MGRAEVREAVEHTADGDGGDPGRSGVPAEPGTPSDADRFHVEIVRAGGARKSGTVVLAPVGELDYDTVAPFLAALEAHAGAERVVVDCSRLLFCDSTGLNALLRARSRVLPEGGRLDLAGLRPPVDRMFEITGARTVFRVYEDVGEALADAWPGNRS